LKRETLNYLKSSNEGKKEKFVAKMYVFVAFFVTLHPKKPQDKNG